jgi:hypothetical protein
MLLSRDDATRLVRMTVESEANRFGVSMTNPAIERLANVPAGFGGGGSVDIDPEILRQSIRDMIAAIERQGVRVVDTPFIDNFLSTWACHYLWFC